MENTYWNGKGKNQSQFDELVELMPSSGKSEVVAGELIRAANRLAYDFYNNGMGNNTSGAINFLDYYCVLDMDRTNIFGKIYEYSRGRIYQGNYKGDSLQTAIESMMDMTIEFILANPHLKTQANTDDIFDYEDPEQNFCEECDDETDWGSVCPDCEEQYEEEMA
jgi:hypothetical protein